MLANEARRKKGNIKMIMKRKEIVIIKDERLIISNYVLGVPFGTSTLGSLRALMTKAAADGIISMVACLFNTTNLTGTLMPGQSLVALATSSATFFGD